MGFWIALAIYLTASVVLIAGVVGLIWEATK